MTVHIAEYDSLMERIIERSPTHIVGGKSADLEYIKVHKQHFLKILNSLPERKSLRILDIGVTPNTYAIKSLHPDCDVCAIDITDYMEKGCNEFGIGFKICNLEREQIPFPNNYFDVIIFTEVLEHLFVRPSDVLAKIERIMKPSGLLIFTVPNIATFTNRIGFLFGRSPLQQLDEAIKPGKIQEVGHIHEYTMEEVQSFFRSSLFEIIFKDYYTILEDHSNPFTRIGLKNTGIIGTQKVFSFFVPSFRTTILILAKKRPLDVQQ